MSNCGSIDGISQTDNIRGNTGASIVTSYKNVTKVVILPLAAGYWPLAAGLLSLATCLWIGQQQEAGSQ